MQRLCSEYAELGPLLILVFAGTLPDAEIETRTHGLGDVAALLPRGHADGSIDPTLDEAWFLGIIWAYSSVAFEQLALGTTSKHAVTEQYLRRVDAAIRA